MIKFLLMSNCPKCGNTSYPVSFKREDNKIKIKFECGICKEKPKEERKEYSYFEIVDYDKEKEKLLLDSMPTIVDETKEEEMNMYWYSLNEEFIESIKNRINTDTEPECLPEILNYVLKNIKVSSKEKLINDQIGFEFVKQIDNDVDFLKYIKEKIKYYLLVRECER